MFRHLIFFLKTLFSKKSPQSHDFAVLDEDHNKELELRIRKLELASIASLTTLKTLLQIKALPTKLPFNNYITDDSKQPTIH